MSDINSNKHLIGSTSTNIPLNNDNKNDKIKKKQIKNKIRMQNKNLFHFNLSSTFIFEPRLCSFWYNKLENKNKMKINDEEIQLLINNIDNIKLSSETFEPKLIKIIISKEIQSKILSTTLIETQLNENSLLIDEIIKENENKTKISCKKISQIFKDKHSKNISSSHVWYIIHNKLNLRFLKTPIKTSKLINKASIYQSWFFLKVFIRILKLNGNFIYIDESSFYTKNNHYKQWRKKDQDIFHDIRDDGKINLLMAVSSEKIIYFKTTKFNTNNKVFIEFFSEMLSKLSEDEKNKSLFILDNCTIHSTAECFELYNSQKLKVLFTVPYRSCFNMIEYCFRNIKNVTYKLLFSTIDEVDEKIKEILTEEKFITSLKYLFKETLNNYLSFINKYKENNLN